MPRDYSAAAGVVLGGAALACAVAMLPRYGWLVHWPLGHLALGWYVAALALLAASLILRTTLDLRWRHALRGHGVRWTREWAERRPYAARVLAGKALRYMGE